MSTTKEYVIRSACYRYAQVTIPKESDLKVGDEVTLYCDGDTVFIAPSGRVINVKALARAVKQ